MSDANKTQIGGTHYSKFGDLQHWDVVARNDWGYLLGCATKYIFRWRDKAGIVDLQKSRHYIVKYRELLASLPPGTVLEAPVFSDALGVPLTTSQIVKAFNLDYWQGQIVRHIEDWRSSARVEYLDHALDTLDDYIKNEDARIKAEAVERDQDPDEWRRNVTWNVGLKDGDIASVWHEGTSRYYEAKIIREISRQDATADGTLSEGSNLFPAEPPGQ